MTQSAADEPLVSPEEVEAARERIADVAHRTPLDPSETLAERSGAGAVHLKLENIQKTGSYKIRGAYNRISQLSQADRERGVIASSGGNHAQGVAYAAREHGVDATIVMPEATPASKVQATRGYGAEVVVHGDIYQECHEHALNLADERDLAFVPPFDHRDVIAGQGTVGLGILEDLPEVDTVVAAIGGGGLVSGLATALEASLDDVRVVGVQTEGAGHMSPSLARGEIHELDEVDTIAEGIAASRTEPFTFRHVRERVERVVEVTDADVTAAMALLAERAKQVVEPAGALPVAAILGDDLDVVGETVACVVSGGNLDLGEHAEWTRRGLVELDRYVTLGVALADWPGGVTRLVDAVEDADAEVDDLRRELPGAHTDVDPNRQVVAIGIEVTGPDHRERVRGSIREESGLSLLDGNG